MASQQLLSADAATMTEKEHTWVQVAQDIWLNGGKTKRITPNIIEQRLWNPLQKTAFEYRVLALLESLKLLEYLWAGYDDSSTNQHVLLIGLLVQVKSRENIPVWTAFSSDPARFSSLFRRILSLSLDVSLDSQIRSAVLSFLIVAFQSLDNGLVRKECAPLVSISIWHNLASEDSREMRFEENPQLRKAWRAAGKRFEAADEEQRARLRFERAWLYTMVLEFVTNLYSIRGDRVYCERFLELLTDLESQLPTRRYVNALLKDLNILALIRLCPLFKAAQGALLRDLFALLRHYVYFSIDDNTGVQMSRDQANERHYKDLAKLQRTALKYFKHKLTILALANYGAIDQRQDLESHLSVLDDQELRDLCSRIGIRITYPSTSGIQVSRELLMESILVAYEGTKPFQDALGSTSILPTEASIYDDALLRNESYDGSHSLAIPKLNLQYLSIGDFLWRSFILYRCEQFFEIRKFLEDTIKRLRPYGSSLDQKVEFAGFSRMAIPITKPAILETAPPKVGQEKPAFVRAEITLNVGKLADNVRRDWESLRPEDTVYLLAVQPADEPQEFVNGHSAQTSMRESGLLALRTAEVVQLLDENGRSIRDSMTTQTNGNSARPRIRRLLVNLDAEAFVSDSKSKETSANDIYERINLVVRRNQRENNFRRILETIRSLALSQITLPSWLRDVFLGFGDPSAAVFTRLANQLRTIDFRDTFLDWDHITNSFPDKHIKTDSGEKAISQPPYVIEFSGTTQNSELRPSKKRRREDMIPETQTQQAMTVSTYRPLHKGPYPYDAPKLNRIRFTPTQIDAITSGTQPGLTLIVGPPGTGKTDVATQIINNIYHDFPSQRTLLIAHSNQALNQLFQKIVNLDIDSRHLLRLGQGEGELNAEENFGKYGRVESFMDNRSYFLSEVDRLAANLGAPGAHGNSCETAGYFHKVYVVPAWTKFWELAHASNTKPATIVTSFPFHQYFSNAPQPIFPPKASKGEILEIAQGCQYHINKIFSELEDIRPFEIIRSNKDKTNYLMIKEARIIAMTSTHAAMRRHEIVRLGFHYDNVIMEEAAQVTEIENFIPLALQIPKEGSSPLKRVVLCGDHLQNSPVVQNIAFRHFANLEQSLFLRLVRLGVPTINLDFQGRARPSIAKLYKWRYPNLENLPNVLTEAEYLRANAGFRYDYQFVDVPNYKGIGESQPTSHYFQNLGEAEYAVAIFQYMRLLGYPASKISILTTYAGQRALIRDVLGHRCAGNRLFGMPRIVATVDKYQGEQNDYIILSLVRTSRPGYLRDIRRLTVALSRARLGLYILGRRTVFESSPELAAAFKFPLERPDKLMLTTDEMYPTRRKLEDEVNGTEMAGVEHLGQYVYDMTQAKVQMLKSGEMTLPPQESDAVLDVEGDEEDKQEAEEDEEEIEGPEMPGDLNGTS